MAQLPPLNHAISPSEPNLIPRREFIRDQHVLSTFSILALSGHAFVRLYSFPPTAVNAIRRLLDQSRIILSYREDVPNNFCEFAVEGRPWSNPKNTQTEKLLVDIFAVLYRNGHDFLSTIDYGREQDDRIVIAFSRPNPPAFQSPLASSSRLHRSSEGSSTLIAPPAQTTKVPFAISFPNTTTLRVISPPLHSTPAILQTVRGSWPRGVVSEKKVGDNVYEFKLKGYKWFQEDTFATDSLRHILALLASFDKFGFSLLTSLSMTSRSRVKDLWIFTGVAPVMPPDSPPASPVTSGSDLRGGTPPEKHREHKRSQTAPSRGNALPADARSGHPRAVTEGNVIADDERRSSLKPAILRKPAPRAQLPVSVAISTASNDNSPAPEAPVAHSRSSEDLVRVTMASTVGSAVNMTGIGTRRFHQTRTPSPPAQSPAVFYTAAPHDNHNPYFPASGALRSVDNTSVPGTAASPLSTPRRSSPEEHAVGQQPTDHTTSRIKPSSPHSPRANGPPPASTNPSHTSQRLHMKHQSGTPTPPLLGSDVFRDSAMSYGSEKTAEIPITWTGQGQEMGGNGAREPVLPGGWVSPTPGQGPETPRGNGEAEFGGIKPPPKQITPETQVVKSVEPELVQPQPHHIRKSEAGVLGDMPIAAHSRKEQGRRRSHPGKIILDQGTVQGGSGSPKPATTTAGEGWVLVNVGTNTPFKAAPPSTPPAKLSSPSLPLTPTRTKEGSRLTSPTRPAPARNPPSSTSIRNPQSPPQTPGGTMSPTAKAIVIIDALDAKRNAEKDADGSHSSGLRRLFSLSHSSSSPKPSPAKVRKRSSATPVGGVSKNKSFEQEDKAGADEKKAGGMRERWRRKGPSETSKPDSARKAPIA